MILSSPTSVLYLAHLANRIAILPAFSAHTGHLGHNSLDVAVSEIFDLSRMSGILDDEPIVEMHELKVMDHEPSRLRNITYDGEFVQADAEGREYQIGDIIPPEEIELDEIGCWSFWETARKSASGTEYAGLIRELSLI
jgi:hypothetical protein